MRRNVVVDAGPLVAYVDRKDRFHDWALATMNEIEAPQYSCEPVLVEACFLVQHLPGAVEGILEMVSRRLLALPFRIENEAVTIARLLKKYSDVPMSLADACLVRMAETIAESAVLTLDSDFKIYRKHGRRVIPTILPR